MKALRLISLVAMAIAMSAAHGARSQGAVKVGEAGNNKVICNNAADPGARTADTNPRTRPVQTQVPGALGAG